VSSKGPKKIRAYEETKGPYVRSSSATRPVFATMGFRSRPVTLPDDSIGYRGGPREWLRAGNPLRRGRTTRGATEPSIPVASDPRAPSASLMRRRCERGRPEFSAYYTPVRARSSDASRLALWLQCSTNKDREVEPLVIDVLNGISYLVARVRVPARSGIPILAP